MSRLPLTDNLGVDSKPAKRPPTPTRCHMLPANDLCSAHRHMIHEKLLGPPMIRQYIFSQCPPHRLFGVPNASPPQIPRPALARCDWRGRTDLQTPAHSCTPALALTLPPTYLWEFRATIIRKHVSTQTTPRASFRLGWVGWALNLDKLPAP